MTLNYFLRRLATLLLVLFGVSVVAFSIIQLIPGDPARVVLGTQASPEGIAAVRARLGLDQPLVTQYVNWVGGILRGDFGQSLITGQSITRSVTRRLVPTLVLALAALLVGLLIAIPFGTLSALKPGGRRDTAASIFSQIGVSIPDFWMGIMLIFVFSESLRWMPSSGFAPITAGVGPFLRHLLLPALTAGLISGSIMTRFVRSAMLDVLQGDYVRTARAKGVRERSVLLKHVFRNATIPIVTIVGLQMATLLSRVVVVEIVFAWPGLGRLALESTLQRDYPVLQATVLLTATIFALMNLITDLSYVLLDPSVEYA